MATTEPITAQDLMALGKDAPYELIMGELVEVSLAPAKASIIAVNITCALDSFVRPRTLGLVVGANCGFWLTQNPDTVVAPDAAIIRGSRIPHDVRMTGYVPGTPDLAVEVTSSFQRPGEVERRIELYLSAGTTLVWVVESGEDTIDVVRPNKAQYTLDQGDMLDGEDVLPGFRLPIADIFDSIG